MPEDTEQLIADLQRMGEENMRLKARVAELEAAIQDTHSALGDTIEHEGIRLHAIRTKARLVDAELHWSRYKDRVAKLETTVGFLRSALHNCASHAGLPDPATGCRAIIATVKDALSIP